MKIEVHQRPRRHLVLDQEAVDRLCDGTERRPDYPWSHPSIAAALLDTPYYLDDCPFSLCHARFN